jgi:hypothetical protein
MKSFTFEREAKWMVVISLAGPAIGVLLWLIVWLVRLW